MLNIIKRIGSILIILGGVIDAEILLAQDDIKHHLIVLIDRSGDMHPKGNRSEERKRAIGELLTQDLQSVCFTTGEVIPERPLLNLNKSLENQDYLSVLSFGLDGDSVDFNDFIQAIYTYKQDYNSMAFQDVWNTIDSATDWTQKSYSFFSTSWTGLSWAMPMALSYAGEHRNQITVHRTFLILISNERYNPATEGSEEAAIQNNTPQDIDFTYANQSHRQIYQSFIEEDKKILSERDSIKLRVFEFIPNTRTFSIKSFVSHSEVLEFKRKPGEFQAELNLDIQHDTEFVPLAVRAFLFEKTSRNVLKTQTLIDLQTPVTVPLTFSLDNSYYNSDLQLLLEFQVHFKDALYGAHILFPDGDESQGAKGLWATVNVQFEQIKTVLGVMPLSDRMFAIAANIGRAKSQDAAIRFWKLIIIGGIVAIIMIIMLAIVVLVWKSFGKKKPPKKFTYNFGGDNDE